MIYPLDLTGSLASNLITNEQKHVGPPAQISDASLIIPNAAPFFYDSLKIRTGTNNSGTLLVEGVDYQLIFPYEAMVAYVGMILYGGIRILNRAMTQDLYLAYQTPGGTYTINAPLILSELQRRVAFLNTYNWEDLVDVPTTYPPAFHLHEESSATMQAVVGKLEQLITLMG